MPVTLESNRILIDTVEVETVKTHVPEVDIDIDIVPAITNSEGDPAFELLTYTHSGGSEDQTEFNLTINEETTCDILIVGGGGGGGSDNSGGGGAGGLVLLENITLYNNITIKVGRGGAGAVSGQTNTGQLGKDSSIVFSETYVAKGGGGGGTGQSSATRNSGTSGGSGGGSAYESHDGSPGTSTQDQYILNGLRRGWGFAGGDGKSSTGSSQGAGGGGGGASEIGIDGNVAANKLGGRGGDGKYEVNGRDFKTFFNITDTTIGDHIDGKVYFAGGGGGGNDNDTNSTNLSDGSGYNNRGGFGGGGDGGYNSSNRSNPGIANTGGGGGGATFFATNYKGGDGGSGIVIIKKYLKPVALYETQTTVVQYPVLPADSTNLVAWYKFDGDFTDSSENGNDLTESSTIPFILSGLIDESIDLSSSAFLTTNTVSMTNKTFSISFWAKFNTAPSGSNQYFFSQGTENNTGKNLTFNYQDTNHLRFSFWGGSGYDIDTSGYDMTNFLGSTWHHYVVTFNNTTRAGEIWVDNQKLTTNISTFSTSFTGGGSFYISKSSTYNSPFNGQIDDFRIYDKALSAYEIDILANNKIENPDYKTLTFTHDGSANNQTEYTVNFPEETEYDILIVGGGGGGGSDNSGGGGAGGLVFLENEKINGNIIVKVGNGGIGGSIVSQVRGYNGNSSSLNNFEALGGGGGGVGNGDNTGYDGGSGGGGAGESDPGTGGNELQTTHATIGFGNNGGNGGSGSDRGGGGGGGAGTIGGNAGAIAHNSEYGGPGGDGLYILNSKNFKTHFNITDTSVGEHKNGYVYFAGGGGGGNKNSRNAMDATDGSGKSNRGGWGGGGAGGLDNSSNHGSDGLPNTGGGGGGSHWNGSTTKGGNGGSGIVIIRYYTKYIRQHPAYDAQWTYHSTNPNVHHYGNVGIGTLASETNKLTIKGDMNMIGNYKQNDVNLGNWYSSDNIHNIHRLTGNVGIGTTDPQYSVDTSGVLYASHGGFTGGTSTNWATSSDERIKDNITSASNETCYENVKNINLYKFNYKEQFANNKNETQYGFIAQEVQKYYPKAVKYEKIKVKDDTYENFLTINQTQLNYTLFGAVKHLQLELENIKVKLGMTVPVTEEPVTEETNTTEEPVVEETNTTEEPVVEETNTTEEPVAEETNTTEEPVAEETNTTEEPVTEETNTTEEPVVEETNTTEEPVAEETNTT